MSWTSLKLVILSLIAAALIVLLSWQTFLNEVQNIGYDFILRVAGGFVPASDVVIVAIDEASLDRHGAWPWSREVQAELLSRVGAGEPSAVGIDILMDDVTNAEADQAMADAIRQTPNLVLAARVDDSGSELAWQMPLPRFQAGASGIGHVHADPDLDSVIRRIVTAKHAKGEVWLAFALEVLKAAGRLPDGYEEDLGGSRRVVAEQVMIRFAGDRGTFEHVPAWEVLEGRTSPDQFAGRIVLIGTTADGLGDEWMTPVSVAGRPMSGIEVHANALESIYSNRNVSEVPGWIVLIVLAGTFLFLRWVERRYEGFRFYVVAVATIPACVVISWLLMRGGLWLPFPTFVLAVGLFVPTLGVRKLVKVNRDLDDKISRLSVWAAEPPASNSTLNQLRSELDTEIKDTELKDQWIHILDRYDNERHGRSERRERLLASRRHNAPWKLEAVDFFNEQLYRFVSFNDAVLAGIEDCIIVSDPAGQVVYQNTAARKLAAFSEEPPQLWQYLSALLDGRPLMEDFARVISSEEQIHADAVPSSPGSRYFALTLSPISSVGVVATLHDVTAQRELDQAKNDMVALVSHELRTPLTSIRGYGDMLRKYGLVEGKGQEFLASILKESARLNDLIQSFLDVASIESGKRKLDRTEFEIEPLIDDLLASLKPVAEVKQIAIENAIGRDAGVISADRVLLYQALVNLVSNAIKYSPKATQVRIEFNQNDGIACFRVEDQGHGIEPEDANRIFEKFYRRSTPETQAETGFGLGLPFVRQVAEQHGGGVGVESEVGKGSVFSLWIANR